MFVLLSDFHHAYQCIQGSEKPCCKAMHPGFINAGPNKLNCSHFMLAPNIFEGSLEDMFGELPSEKRWLV